MSQAYKTISYAEHLVVSGPSFDAFLAREVDEHMGDDDEAEPVEDDRPYDDDEPEVCGQFWSP